MYHNEDAEWLKCLEGDQKDVEQQNNVTITIEMVQKQLRKYQIGSPLDPMDCGDFG